MHQHVLDPILECDGTGVAGSTGPPQFKHDVPVLEPAVLNISTILLDGRPDSCLQKLFNHSYHLAIVLVVSQRILFAAFLPRRFGGVVFDRINDLLTRSDGFRDHAEYFRFQVRPVCVGCFGHGDEVCAIENGGDVVNV